MAEADRITPDQALTLLRVLPVALVVGLGRAFGGAWLRHFHLALALHGAEAQGEVVALAPGSTTSASGQAALFPVVSSTAPAGRAVTFRHRTGRRPPAYRIGETVPVTDLPAAPERALIAEGYRNWLLPGLLVLAGPLLAGISVTGMRAARRRLRI